jgi:hypothetical protein
MRDYPGLPFPFPTIWYKQSQLHFFAHYACVVCFDCIHRSVQYYQALPTSTKSCVTTLHIYVLRKEQKSRLGAIWDSCFVHYRLEMQPSYTTFSVSETQLNVILHVNHKKQTKQFLVTW